MIQNTMQPIIVFITYLSAATLLILARVMQETYSEHGERNDIRGQGNIIEIMVAIPVTLVVLQTTLIGTLSLIGLFAAPITECLTSIAI